MAPLGRQTQEPRRSGRRSRTSSKKADMMISTSTLPAIDASPTPHAATTPLQNVVSTGSESRRPKRRKINEETYQELHDTGYATSPDYSIIQNPAVNEYMDEKRESGSSDSSPSTGSSTIKVNSNVGKKRSHSDSSGTSLDSFMVTLHDYPMNVDPAGIALWVLQKIQSVREAVPETSGFKLGDRRASQSLKRVIGVAAKLNDLELFQEGFGTKFTSRRRPKSGLSAKAVDAAKQLLDVIPSICEPWASQRSQAAADKLFEALGNGSGSLGFMEALRVLASSPHVQEGIDALVNQLRLESSSGPAKNKPQESAGRAVPQRRIRRGLKTEKDSPSPNGANLENKVHVSQTIESPAQQTSLRKPANGDVLVESPSEDNIVSSGEVSTEIRSSGRERKPTAKALAAGIRTSGNSLPRASPHSNSSPTTMFKPTKGRRRKMNFIEKVEKLVQKASKPEVTEGTTSFGRVRTSSRRGRRPANTPVSVTSASIGPVIQTRATASQAKQRDSTNPSRLRIRASKYTTKPTFDIPPTTAMIGTALGLHRESEKDTEALTEEQMLANLFACAAEADEYGSDSEVDEDDEVELEREDDGYEDGQVEAVQEGDVVELKSVDVTMSEGTPEDTDELDNVTLLCASSGTPENIPDGSSLRSAAAETLVVNEIHDQTYPPVPDFPQSDGQIEPTRVPGASVPQTNLNFATPDISYAHITRPYTDKDGWTLTGIQNHWAEEIVEIDRSEWVSVPSTSTAQYPTDLPKPRRVYKSRKRIDEERIFGFPPVAGKQNLPKDPRRPSNRENVNLEFQTMCARKAAVERGLQVDRGMPIKVLEEMIDDHDNAAHKNRKEAETRPMEQPRPPFLQTDAIRIIDFMAEEYRERPPRRQIDAPDLDFQHLARSAPLLSDKPVVHGTSTIDFMADEQRERQRQRQIDAPDLNFSHLAKKAPLLSQNQAANMPTSGFGKLLLTPVSRLDANGNTRKSQYHQLRDAQAAKKRAAAEAKGPDGKPVGLNGSVTEGVFNSQMRGVKRSRGPDPNFKVISRINLQGSTTSRQLPDFKRGGKIMKFN